MLLVLLFFLIGKNHAIEPIDLIMEINEESLLIQKLSTESVKNKKIESFYENYFVDGKNIGQIDIDSHVIDPFTAEDERFLEFVNAEVAKLY